MYQEVDEKEMVFPSECKLGLQCWRARQIAEL